MTHPLPQTEYTCLQAILDALFAAAPRNKAMIEEHYRGKTAADFDFIEGVAEQLLRIIGGRLQGYVEDYAWTCRLMLQCEMQYRRAAAYENTRFEDVVSGLYSSAEDMRRYMRGLMLSQVLWRQHIGPLQVFAQDFLPSVKDAASYLEIGPGHGLWLARAGAALEKARLSAWDISPHSLTETQEALGVLGLERSVDMAARDICSSMPDGAQFDIVVMSQVIETVSDPAQTMRNIASLLTPGGKVFLNIPVRAAAPDHIRRWADEDAPLALVKDAGLSVRKTWLFGARGEDIGSQDGFSLVVVAVREA